MASRAKGSLTPTAASVESLVSAIVDGGIEYDDVVKALNFDKVQLIDFVPHDVAHKEKLSISHADLGQAINTADAQFPFISLVAF